MPKDYARRNLKNARTRRNKSWRVELLWTAVAIISLSVVGGCLYVYKKYPMLVENQRFASYIAQLKAIIHPKKPNQNVLIEPAKEANGFNTEQDVHFDFYTELPHMQVTVSNKEEKPEIKSVSNINKTTALNNKPSEPAAASTQYILQLGMFKDALEASQLRLSLLLNGCEADVVKVNTGEGDVYRVQRGPFISLAEAKVQLRQLQKKGVIVVLKKI